MPHKIIMKSIFLLLFNIVYIEASKMEGEMIQNNHFTVRKVFNRGLTSAHFTVKIILFYDSHVDARPHITRLDYGARKLVNFLVHVQRRCWIMRSRPILFCAQSQVTGAMV